MILISALLHSRSLGLVPQPCWDHTASPALPSELCAIPECCFEEQLLFMLLSMCEGALCWCLPCSAGIPACEGELTCCEMLVWAGPAKQSCLNAIWFVFVEQQTHKAAQ